jgi:hypothetical protein
MAAGLAGNTDVGCGWSDVACCVWSAARMAVPGGSAH